MEQTGGVAPGGRGLERVKTEPSPLALSRWERGSDRRAVRDPDSSIEAGSVAQVVRAYP